MRSEISDLLLTWALKFQILTSMGSEISGTVLIWALNFHIPVLHENQQYNTDSHVTI